MSMSNGTGIVGLTDITGKDVAIARFEPLLIGSIFPIHGEDRIVVTPEQVPPMLPAALKAVEDRNFDTHHGIDPARRAADAVGGRAGPVSWSRAAARSPSSWSRTTSWIRAAPWAARSGGDHGGAAGSAFQQDRHHDGLYQ